MMMASLSGLGLFALGCAEKTISTMRPRPSLDWPSVPIRPTPALGSSALVRNPSTPTPSTGSLLRSRDPLHAMERIRWTRDTAIAGRVNPMNGIRRMTVHHEGWTTVWFSDERTTAARIQQIRHIHVRDRGWGDIGYHYIIDRAGRVWQGRDLRYQGAHVKANNEHNLGVLVLGNFEKQPIPDAQMLSVQKSLYTLAAYHRVPAQRIYTHRELNPTQCPGRYLQPKMDHLRSNGTLT